MEITVLLAVYNGGEWLKDSIDSILEQTFRDFEFLIINDGSTDSTKDILKIYEKNDARIRIINQENIGLTKSLIKGVNKAKGKWIARIDSDDISFPERLQKQYIFATDKMTRGSTEVIHLLEEKPSPLQQGDLCCKKESTVCCSCKSREFLCCIKKLDSAAPRLVHHSTIPH